MYPLELPPVSAINRLGTTGGNLGIFHMDNRHCKCRNLLRNPPKAYKSMILNLPNAVIPPNLISLPLHNCNFAALMNRNVNI